MQVVGYILLGALILFVTWFAIDTVRVVIKKIKLKKAKKKVDEVDVVDTTEHK